MRLPKTLRPVLLFVVALRGFAGRVDAESDLAPVDVVISVPDQKLLVVREGGLLKKYKISTSRFGIGDNYGSYKTPAGRLRVWEKLGGELAPGAVIKHRSATGEILSANAPGRDPIVSRILWLEGLEGQNDTARGRGIYIHGTTEEHNIGKPVSWGCIRMRSEDVIELYDLVPVGAMVTISEEALPHLAKWKPAPPPVIASQPAPVVPVRLAANPLPRLRREAVEHLPAVAEMLRPSDEHVVPASAGVANAFRGSILFAGLPVAPKPAQKSAGLVVKGPAVAESHPIAEAFSLAASPPAPEDFSLRPTLPDPPMRLIDLRRLAVTAAGNIFDAPSPKIASLDREKSSPPLREEREDMLLVRRANAALGNQPAH
jgi:lipoprotein-anchoring transpeptidase ErfK/SrfK